MKEIAKASGSTSEAEWQRDRETKWNLSLDGENPETLR